MTISPESLALLHRAAEVRAAGTSWADTAAQLAVESGELRRLAADHSRDYDRLARRARTEVVRETLDAALATLRAQLKSPDARVSLMAAMTIVRFDLARMRHGSKGARDRLARDSRRPHRTLTAELDESRAQNVSESPEVPIRNEVVAAKNMAKSSAPNTTSTSPAPVPTVGPVANHPQAPQTTTTRGNSRLIDEYALGGTSPAFARDNRLDLEIQRVVSGSVVNRS